MENVNLQKELRKYLKNWPWFFLCLILCMVLGFVYLRYTTPVYSATASIIIKDESNQGSGGPSAIYGDLGFLAGMAANNIQNEIGILSSRRLMNDVVKSLNIHIQYFIEGDVRTVEIYDDLPFSLQVLRLDESKLKKIGAVEFEIKKQGLGFSVKDIMSGKFYTINSGNPLNLGFMDIVLSSNDSFEELQDSEAVIMKITDVEKIAAYYRNQIIFSKAEENSTLIELELKDPVKEKARDILDQLILEYNRSAIEDKNLIAGNTANFINERLDIINGELDSVETGKENFKERNRLTDIQAESQLFLQNASDYNKRRQEVGTQLELANAMLEYISSGSSTDLLPANLGIEEKGVNQEISEYNNLVLERNRILAGSSEKNPIVIRMDNQLEQIKGNVVASLGNLRSNLLIGREELNRQTSSIGSKIYAVPSKERQYRGIERQQNIKETLYLFLLQKREENSLSLAVTEPKAKIVDRGYYYEGAVFPKPINVYLGSFVLAMFIPFSVIYMKGMLDNKVRKRSDIENLSKDIPLAGVIPATSRKNTIIKNNDRSVLAESFRILITNLQYLLVNASNKKGGATIFVTSTIKGEGKTFTSLNLAITLTNTGKKVLLVGADLRNPKLQPHMRNTKNLVGLSDFLINEDIALSDIIDKTKLHPDLDLLTSGSIPPNPYELLKQEKLELTFNILKSSYDYIIVDTAPSMLVADTFLIAKYADLVLYVTRAGYTEKELLEFAIKAKEEGKFQTASFLLNDVKKEHLGYGNKYGYGYGQEKKSLWSRRN